MAMHYGPSKWLTTEDSDRSIIWALTVSIKERKEVPWRRRFAHDLMAHKYGQGTYVFSVSGYNTSCRLEVDICELSRLQEAKRR
jgi:hypothetical protein